jgi:hypothetical protein
VRVLPEGEPSTEAAVTFQEFAATRLPAVLAFAAPIPGRSSPPLISQLAF